MKPMRQIQLENLVPPFDVSPLFKKKTLPSPTIPYCKMWQIFYPDGLSGGRIKQ